MVKGIGPVHGSRSFQIAKEAYLLEVLHPFVVDNEEVHYLLVTSRFSDSSLDEVMNGEGAVIVARIRPGMMLKAGDEYGGFDFEEWAIGWIKSGSV